MSDARRRAALHALGLPVTYVRRASLDATERAALLPRLPGTRPAGTPVAASAPAPVAAAAVAPSPPPSDSARAAAVSPPPRPAAATAAGADPRVAPARLRQIATLEADTLDGFCQSCRACKLGAQRHLAVPGSGHAHAHLMVVGEAPGADEDRLGQPFVGAAGQLLDHMLRAIGFARDAGDPAHAVYLTNVIKCRPPGNRNPEPDEIAQCRPILQRQIELVRPRVLLALGRFAAQTLSGSDEPIGRLRQQRLQHQGVPLVVSYHPAYLLRSPQDKAKAWADLCLTLDLLGAAPNS